MILAATDQVERAERYLAGIPGAAARAMSKAMNRAAGSARAEAVRAITARYATRTTDVRNMIKLSTSTPDRLEVAITARSSALSLGYFPHTPKKPGTGGPGRPALRAEIKRGAGKEVRGAFVVRVNSGLRVMTRTGQKTSSGRDGMRSLYTIPLAEMMGRPDVREAVEEAVIETLDRRLSHEITRELEAAS